MWGAEEDILDDEEGARWNSGQCGVLANGLDLVRQWREGCQIKQMEALLQDVSVYESKGSRLLAECRDPSNWLIKALVKAEFKDEFLEIFQGFLDSMNGFMAITEAMHIPVQTQTNKQIPAEAPASGSFSGQLSVDIRLQKVLPAAVEDSSKASKLARLELAGFPPWAYSDLLDLARNMTSIIDVKLPEAAASDRRRLVEHLTICLRLSSAPVGAPQTILDKYVRKGLHDENSQELLSISQYLLQRLSNAGTKNVLHLDPPDLTYEGEALGHGAFGVVRKARWRGLNIAVKEYSFHGLLCTEVQNMLSLTHINVIRGIGYYTSQSGKKKRPRLLMECMSCDLEKFIEEMDGQGGVPLVTSIEILLQIAKGMEYLHKNKVIHRDLKPGNILLNRSEGEGHFTVKITDFGTSRIRFDTAQLTHVTGKRGTTKYMAPEVWEANEDGDKEVCYSKKVDVYSFAMVCYEILTGNAPDVHPKAAKEGKRPDLSHCLLSPPHPALVHLMQQCWDSDAKKRPSFCGIHKFLQVLKSIILFRPEEMGQYHALATKILGKNMGLDTDDNVISNVFENSLVEESEPIEEDTHTLTKMPIVAGFLHENGNDNLVQESEPAKNLKFLDTDENEENKFLDTDENVIGNLVEESETGKNMEFPGLVADENGKNDLIEESEPIKEDNLVEGSEHGKNLEFLGVDTDENGKDNLVQESEPGKNPKFLDTDENEDNKLLDTYENEENKLEFLPPSCQKGNLLLPIYFDWPKSSF